MLKKLILLCCLLWLPASAWGQKLLLLTDHRSKEKFFILSGDRVKCKFINGTQETGYLKSITDSTFEINGKTFFLDSLTAIAKRKRGTVLLVVAVEAAGFALIFSGSILTQVQLDLVAAAQIIILIRPVYNYLMRRISKWDIEAADIIPRKNRPPRDLKD